MAERRRRRLRQCLEGLGGERGGGWNGAVVKVVVQYDFVVFVGQNGSESVAMFVPFQSACAALALVPLHADLPVVARKMKKN